MSLLRGKTSVESLKVWSPALLLLVLVIALAGCGGSGSGSGGGSGTYPIAALKDAKDPTLAKKWLDLVTSSEGQRVLKKWNFEPAAQ
jgi:hypothetical protein